MRSLNPLMIAGSVVLLAACSVTPEYERPELLLPSQWPEPLLQDMEESVAAAWWQRFDDPVLDNLLIEALGNNLDIGLAAARVEAARAELGFRRADELPTIGALIEADRENPGLTGGNTESEFLVAGTLSYELDLWGRLSGSTDVARAELLGTAYGEDAVRLSVITDIISAYFDYRGARERIRIAEDTIDSRRESLLLEQIRFRGEDISELPVRQAEAELQTSLAELPAIRAEALRGRRILAILVGDAQAVLQGLDGLGEMELPELGEHPAALPEMLPSDLLERRPDIRAAEAFLIASNADVGVVRANWFPRVDLFALAGTGATQFGDLFTGLASLYEVFGSVTAPILEFGRRQASIDGAIARREAAELQYRMTVMEAFREVGDAWTMWETANAQLEARNLEVKALVQVVAAAERRYRGGYTPYIEVLDARRALFSAQLARVDASRDRLVAKATLFKAMGGGWSDAAIGEDAAVLDEMSD